MHMHMHMQELPASWAMPYQSSDVGGAVPPLDTTLRALHKLVGNVNPDEAPNLLMCTVRVFRQDFHSMMQWIARLFA
jgi:hypothetical protein